LEGSWRCSSSQQVRTDRHVYNMSIHIYICRYIEIERETCTALVIGHIPDLWLFHHAYSHWQRQLHPQVGVWSWWRKWEEPAEARQRYLLFMILNKTSMNRNYPLQFIGSTYNLSRLFLCQIVVLSSPKNRSAIPTALFSHSLAAIIRVCTPKIDIWSSFWVFPIEMLTILECILYTHHFLAHLYKYHIFVFLAYPTTYSIKSPLLMLESHIQHFSLNSD
jgi:hypothetical protein